LTAKIGVLSWESMGFYGGNEHLDLEVRKMGGHGDMYEIV